MILQIFVKNALLRRKRPLKTRRACPTAEKDSSLYGFSKRS